MRSELRGGVLPQATRERIALAVAEHREDSYSIAQRAKSARRAGLGLDQYPEPVASARRDPKEAALLECAPAGAALCRGRPSRFTSTRRRGRSAGAMRRSSRQSATWLSNEDFPEPDRERGRPTAGSGDAEGPTLGSLGAGSWRKEAAGARYDVLDPARCRRQSGGAQPSSTSVAVKTAAPSSSDSRRSRACPPCSGAVPGGHLWGFCTCLGSGWPARCWQVGPVRRPEPRSGWSSRRCRPFAPSAMRRI